MLNMPTDQQIIFQDRHAVRRHLLERLFFGDGEEIVCPCGICESDPFFFSGIRVAACTENHIDLARLQCFHQCSAALHLDGLEIQMLISQTVIRVLHVVIQHAALFPRDWIHHADARLILQIADADRAMLFDPIPFFVCQDGLHTERKVPLVEILREERAVLRERLHPEVQLFLDVRPIFIDNKINPRFPDLCDIRNPHAGPCRGFQRNEAVDLIRSDFRSHIRIIPHIHMCRMDTILLFPLRQHLLRQRPHEHADTFAIHRRQVRRENARCFRIRIEDIPLLRHRDIRVKHLLRAFVGVGNSSHNVHLAALELFETVRPVAGHILESPARIAGDLLHELIAIAAAHAILIDIIEGIFERTDTHHLSLCAADGHRQQETERP